MCLFLSMSNLSLIPNGNEWILFGQATVARNARSIDEAIRECLPLTCSLDTMMDEEPDDAESEEGGNFLLKSSWA